MMRFCTCISCSSSFVSRSYQLNFEDVEENFACWRQLVISIQNFKIDSIGTIEFQILCSCRKIIHCLNLKIDSCVFIIQNLSFPNAISKTIASIETRPKTPVDLLVDSSSLLLPCILLEKKRRFSLVSSLQA